MEEIFAGNLEYIELPDVLSFINMINKNGKLQFRKDDIIKNIFWEKGEIIFSNSTAPSDSLGAFFVRNGYITQEENRESAEKATKERRQGKILVEMGLIEPRELWWGVKNQTLDIIYSLFSWEKGEFKFFHMEEPIDEKISLNVSTTNIIMEGVRRLDEWKEIKSKIPSYSVIMERCENEPENIDLSKEKSEILSYVTGDHTVREIIKESNMGEFRTNKILYSLLGDGIIKVQEKASLPEDEMDDSDLLQNTLKTYNSIFQHICDVMKEKTNLRPTNVFNEYFESQKDQFSDLYSNIKFNEEGLLDERVLMSNIAELPVSKRNKILDEGLNDLLSFQLFKMTKHLKPDQKEELYEFVSHKKDNLESLERD